MFLIYTSMFLYKTQSSIIIITQILIRKDNSSRIKLHVVPTSLFDTRSFLVEDPSSDVVHFREILLFVLVLNRSWPISPSGEVLSP